MKRLESLALAGVMVMSIASCDDGGGGGDDGSATAPGTISASATISGTATDSGTGMVDDDGGDETGEKLDVGGGGSGPGGGCGGSDLGCTDKIDLLFVIDNSGTMAVEQENLARNFPLLVQQLEGLTDSMGNEVNPDVQIMVTNTDFGNPLCTAFEPEGYEPSRGAPITTPCTQRINDFTGLGSNPDVVPEACTASCVSGAAPEGDPFVAFSNGMDNIPDNIVEADINNDGIPDSPVAQALGCIGPQGINGCGYESPLENMLQALNPSAEWNQGARPFLRPDALLAIAVITDEADCSVQNYDIMTDATYQEVEPGSGMPESSSAICWNAGVSCQGPDANGVYSDCASSSTAETLQPISRYTNYLINSLREDQGKEVVMLGILGVPEVTQRNEVAPFEPLAGGVFDLEYRNWRDGEFTGIPGGGDILPDEFAGGVTAADKQFDFGVGPGCTGGDAVNGFTGQAIPPVRVKEVCESLNIDNGDGTEDIRCCIESICDDDFSPAIKCLAGIIGEAIVVPG
ncbi:MAG: hypothetical protein AAGA54_06080 [Myxococcota bacterium]